MLSFTPQAVPRPLFARLTTSPGRLNVSLQFSRLKHEYSPRFQEVRRAHKGRVPVRTGGSVKGLFVERGDFGLRLKSEGVRLAAKQLQAADNAIMRVIRGTGGVLYKRFVTDVAVCVKGNETRMGKGKGAFDHWAVRVPTGKVLFEVKQSDDLHEKVIRDVLRIASDKLPGVYEVVKRGAAPRVGLKTMGRRELKSNVVEEMIKNPDRELKNTLKSKEEMYRLFRGR